MSVRKIEHRHQNSCSQLLVKTQWTDKSHGDFQLGYQHFAAIRHTWLKKISFKLEQVVHIEAGSTMLLSGYQQMWDSIVLAQ